MRSGSRATAQEASCSICVVEFVMDDSKTSFGPGSRFSQLPLPRKIALGVVVLILGYGIADPAFLSDSAMQPAGQVDQEAALKDFLAHIDARQPSRATPAPDTAATTHDTPVATVSSQQISEQPVQSASYPEQTLALDDPPPAVQVSEATDHDDESILILPGPSRPASTTASPRIRLTGTIYPNSL